MANEQNLIKNENLTPKQRRDNARKAGIASGKARQDKKRLREVLKELLNAPVSDPKHIQALNNLGFKTDKYNNKMLIIAGLYKEAVGGNVKAFEVIRDTIGEKPVEEVEVKDVTPKWFKQSKNMN